MPIQTLNDLFAALFRPAEGGQPVIFQPQRPLREALFALFFPEALTRQYADKSKSNLTWFFNDDRRNKAIKRTLIAMLEKDPRQVVDGVVSELKTELMEREKARCAKLGSCTLGTSIWAPGSTGCPGGRRISTTP